MKRESNQTQPCITFTAPSYALFDLTANGVLTTPHGNLAIFTVKSVAELWARNSKSRIVAVVPVRIAPDNGGQGSAAEELLKARCAKMEAALGMIVAMGDLHADPYVEGKWYADTARAALPEGVTNEGGPVNG